MNEASKKILNSTVQEWGKFTAEREKMTGVANEVVVLARKVIQESLAFLKAQNIDVECDTPEDLKVLKVPIHVEPVVEANFPTVKTSVVLKCGGATRAILINPNMTISAGGQVVTHDQLKKAIPDAFATNGADFVRDAFLYVARTGGKEQ